MASRKTKRIPGPVLFIGGFIIVVGAIIAAILLWPQPDYTYNGFTFIKDTCPGTQVTCWFGELHLRQTDYTISFYHHPTEVEAIGVSPLAVKTVYDFQTIKDGQVTIAVPKNAPGSIGIAATEISRILGQRYNIFNFPITAALSGEGEGEASCTDAAPAHLIVLFRQQDINAVTLDAKNCVVIGATSADEASAVADAFAYRLLGVIAYPASS